MFQAGPVKPATALHMLWSGCETPFTGFCAFKHTVPNCGTVWKVVESFKSGALLAEVSHWEACLEI